MTPEPTSGVAIGNYFGFSGGNYNSLGSATSQLVMPIFSIATFLVILYFLLGAFRYLKAGENKEEVEAAKKMITQGIVGFVILMFAFLILQFLIFSLFKSNIIQIF